MSQSLAKFAALPPETAVYCTHEYTLSIIRFADDAEVVAMANDSRFGLGAYLHTRDLARAHIVAGQLEAGCVAINGMLPMAPNLPFGGYKQSGFGREGGRPGLEEFMQIKQVMLHLP
jgi:aldehyde dehydrogenase (NAD+)